MNSTEPEVARLETAYPAWHIWVVPTAVGPPIWCARHRLDTSGAVINTRNAADLEERLEAQP